MHDLDDLLSLAEATALKAGSILAQRANLTVNSQANHDVKMQADVNSEKFVRAALTEKTPFPIVGEELGGDESLLEGDELYWVVDPLDGTYNYLRSIPMTGVSIGLMRGMEPVLGAIYDFNHDELFSARADGPLLINGKPFTPHWAESLDQAILVTGFPAISDYSDEGLRAVMKEIQRYKKVRMIGAATIHLSYVACGRLDVYLEDGVRLWDIAAGLSLIQAAGGTYHLKRVRTHPFAVKIAAAGKPEWIADHR